MKRYQLVLPDRDYDALQGYADDGHHSVLVEIRRAIRLWLMVRAGDVRITRDGRDVEIVS